MKPGPRDAAVSFNGGDRNERQAGTRVPRHRPPDILMKGFGLISREMIIRREESMMSWNGPPRATSCPPGGPDEVTR
jgi:hypothetical protein